MTGTTDPKIFSAAVPESNDLLCFAMGQANYRVGVLKVVYLFVISYFKSILDPILLRIQFSISGSRGSPRWAKALVLFLSPCWEVAACA